MISIDGTEFHRNSPWKEKASLRGNRAHNLSFVPLHQPIILNTLHTHKGKERGKVKCDESHVTKSLAQLHVHHTIYTLERLSHETDWSGRQQFSQNHGYWLCFRQNLSWEFGKYSPPLLVMWQLKYKRCNNHYSATPHTRIHNKQNYKKKNHQYICCKHASSNNTV